MNDDERKDMTLGARLAAPLRQVIRRVQQIMHQDRYRPEKHYFRGSGPKSRAKNRVRSGSTSSEAG